MNAYKLTPILLGLLTVAGSAWAQTTDVAPAATVPTATAEAAPAGAAAPVADAPKKLETLSVDFPDDEVRNILRNVADLFELNLVIPDTLQGKASIKLRDVTWRQIFKVVLNPIGYTYVEEGNIIRVVTTESLGQEPAMTEVFILNYAKASDVKPSLDAMVEARMGGKIVVDARSNALIVTERPSVLNRIRPIITTLDRATDQVMIETKFIDVNDGDARNIGLNWASLQGFKVGTKGESRVEYKQEASRDPNSVTRTTNQSSTNTTNQLGNVVTDTLGGTLLTSVTHDNTIEKITTSVLSADEFRLMLSALNTTNRSRLVSNPTVVTLNNTEANINIGREFPIPNYTYNQERGVFEVSGFTYKPIGVILKVTPQVNAAGFIRLTVEPEVSSSNEAVTFGGSGGASIPIVQVRKTKTQITLKDGFTLGIGGLMEQDIQDTENKVPLLGDVPGLGRLFRHKSKNAKSHNLVVFITAKTLRPDGASVGEVFDPRMTRAMEIQENELPGVRDGSNPFYTPPPPDEKKKSKKD